LLQHALRGQEWAVDLAVDGMEALARVRELRPAVMIVDAMMPELDGYDVCREIRADATIEPKPYMLMLTAGGHETDRTRADEVGVDEFMTKPFSPSLLRERVRAVLGGAV
jgi:two-component system alkaline phosphatase synthesis response regulator PhoP